MQFTVASFLLTKREKGEVSRWAKEKAPTSTNNKLASDEGDEEDSRKILLESFSFDVKVDGGVLIIIYVQVPDKS